MIVLTSCVYDCFKFVCSWFYFHVFSNYICVCVCVCVSFCNMYILMFLCSVCVLTFIFCS